MSSINLDGPPDVFRSIFLALQRDAGAIASREERTRQRSYADEAQG